MTERTTRRNFLITSAAVAGSIVGSTALQQSTTNTATPAVTMLERVLGHTGVKVPIFGLGGAGQTPLSWQGKERDAVAIIEKALQLGIRYFDTAASYGPSEDYLGKVLPRDRTKLFLASKTDERNRDGAWRELERSLKRLNNVKIAQAYQQLSTPELAKIEQLTAGIWEDSTFFRAWH